MDEFDLEANRDAKENFFDSAVSSINACGCFWTQYLQDPAAEQLILLLEDHFGRDVLSNETYPMMDTVIYRSGDIDVDELNKLTELRDKLFDEGVPYDSLPKRLASSM